MLLAVKAQHGETSRAVEDGVAGGQPLHSALGIFLLGRALLGIPGVGHAQVVHPPLVIVVGVRIIEQVVVGQLFPVRRRLVNRVNYTIFKRHACSL